MTAAPPPEARSHGAGRPPQSAKHPPQMEYRKCLEATAFCFPNHVFRTFAKNFSIVCARQKRRNFPGVVSLLILVDHLLHFLTKGQKADRKETVRRQRVRRRATRASAADEK